MYTFISQLKSQVKVMERPMCLNILNGKHIIKSWLFILDIQGNLGMVCSSIILWNMIFHDHEWNLFPSYTKINTMSVLAVRDLSIIMLYVTLNTLIKEGRVKHLICVTSMYQVYAYQIYPAQASGYSR